MNLGLRARPTESEPTGKILTALSTLAVVLVIYGSWLPFEFDSSVLSLSAAAVLEHIAWVPSDLQDLATNILIFISIGLFVRLRIVFTGRHRVAGVILPFAIAGITSLLAEAGQTLIPQRCASYTDMVMHGIGTLIGVALASPLLFFVRRASSRLKISLAIQPQRTLFLMVASLVVIRCASCSQVGTALPE